jgi:hypothetical protein
MFHILNQEYFKTKMSVGIALVQSRVDTSSGSRRDGATTFSITTMTTLRIPIFRMMKLILTLSIQDSQHNDTRHKPIVSLC